jgi:hypothetical protein
MSAFITNSNWLMPFKKSTFHSEIRTNALFKLCVKNAEILNPNADNITYSRSVHQQLRRNRVLNNKLYL